MWVGSVKHKLYVVEADYDINVTEGGGCYEIRLFSVIMYCIFCEIFYRFYSIIQ